MPFLFSSLNICKMSECIHYSVGNGPGLFYGKKRNLKMCSHITKTILPGMWYLSDQ